MTSLLLQGSESLITRTLREDSTIWDRSLPVIDRRFYRQEYDAEQALADFAEAARNETDLEALTSRLVEVVQEKVQPESASIWMQATLNREPVSTRRISK